MKHRIFGFIMLFANVVFGQEKNFIDKPFIEIAQSEDTLVTPNEIYLSYILSESNLKQYKSIEEVEDIIFKNFEDLKLNPIENLKLTNADNTIKKEFLKGKTTLTNKNFELKLDDVKRINSVFKFLDSVGFIPVKIEKLSYSKSKEVAELMVLKACRNGKRKAELMAKALNKNTGEILYLQTGSIETETDIKPFRGNNYYKYNGDALWWINPSGLNDKYYIDLEMQKIKIKSSVLLRIELK